MRFTDGQPRDKVVLSADGEIGNFGLTARTTRYGKVVAPGATAPLADPTSLDRCSGPTTSVLGAKWITDLELRYKALERIELAIGANNVFDVYPDRSPFGARPASGGGVYPQQPVLSALFGASRRSASTAASSTGGSASASDRGTGEGLGAPLPLALSGGAGA